MVGRSAMGRRRPVGSFREEEDLEDELAVVLTKPPWIALHPLQADLSFMAAQEAAMASPGPAADASPAQASPTLGELCPRCSYRRTAIKPYRARVRAALHMLCPPPPFSLPPAAAAVQARTGAAIQNGSSYSRRYGLDGAPACLRSWQRCSTTSRSEAASTACCWPCGCAPCCPSCGPRSSRTWLGRLWEGAWRRRARAAIPSRCGAGACGARLQATSPPACTRLPTCRPTRHASPACLDCPFFCQLSGLPILLPAMPTPACAWWANVCRHLCGPPPRHPVFLGLASLCHGGARLLQALPRHRLPRADPGEFSSLPGQASQCLANHPLLSPLPPSPHCRASTSRHPSFESICCCTVNRLVSCLLTLVGG